MCFVVDEERGRDAAAPFGIDPGAKIIGIGFIEPDDASREPASLGKRGDLPRKIIRQVQAYQDQLHLFPLIARNGRLKIGYLLDAGHAKSRPEIHDQGMIALRNGLLQIGDLDLFYGLRGANYPGTPQQYDKYDTHGLFVWFCRTKLTPAPFL